MKNFCKKSFQYVFDPFLIFRDFPYSLFISHHQKMRTIFFKTELFNHDKYGIKSIEDALLKMKLDLHHWTTRQEMIETRAKMDIETNKVTFFCFEFIF